MVISYFGSASILCYNNDCFQRIPLSGKQLYKNRKNFWKKIMSTSFYVSSDEVNSAMQSSHNVENCDGELKYVSMQQLREMRHRQLLKNHKGKVIQCIKCEQSWDTVEIINEMIKHLFPLAKAELPEFWPVDITFPLKHEQMEVLSLRYQYDMANLPESATNLRRVLGLITTLFFNTHDWHHHKACFKKPMNAGFISHRSQQINSKLFTMSPTLIHHVLLIPHSGIIMMVLITMYVHMMYHAIRNDGMFL
jgi:hypothetical protein